MPHTPSNWPFPQPPNEAVVTTIHVVHQRQPIVYAARFEEDGGWQFLSADPFEMKDALLVALDEVYALDRSIAALADLAPGWAAERCNASDPWRRYPRPPDENDAFS